MVTAEGVRKDGTDDATLELSHSALPLPPPCIKQIALISLAVNARGAATGRRRSRCGYRQP